MGYDKVLKGATDELNDDVNAIKCDGNGLKGG